MVSHEDNEKTEDIGDGSSGNECSLQKESMIEDKNYKFECLKSPMHNLMRLHIHDKVVCNDQANCGVAWI